MIPISARLFHVNSFFIGGLLPWLIAVVSEHYILAVVLYILFTALACVFLALPGVTFALLSGLLFGPFMGSIICLIATITGAVLSFLAGRYFLKDTIKPAIEKNKMLYNLLFTGNSENEIILFMITRLLPIFPFNLQNFAYGVTDIGIVKYSLATFVFMIPGVAAFTFAAAGMMDNESRPALFVAATVITTLTVAVIMIVKQVYNKRWGAQRG